MRKWMKRLSGNWDTTRIIRLVTGSALAATGLLYDEPLLAVLGAWILVMGILNLSCCGNGACGTRGGAAGGFTRDIKRYRPDENHHQPNDNQ